MSWIYTTADIVLEHEVVHGTESAEPIATMWMNTTCHKVAFTLLLSQMVVVVIFYYKHISMLQQVAPTRISPVHPGADLVGDSGADVHLVGKDQEHTFQHNQISPKQRATTDSRTYKASVAIGMGITTRSRRNREITASQIVLLPFFRSLLQSFCHTASPEYHYQFFLAYDYTDKYLIQDSFISNFSAIFNRFISVHCPRTSRYSIHFVQCSHTRKPAWAQNDAMIEAYMDGADYLYRINDDTKMVTTGWTERFIDALDKFSPPRVGVVGPKHQGGNTRILTYDFTHRTHVDIHGFHYPREFTDWFGDRWVTDVYKPGRSLKLPDVKLVHTMEAGQRYATTTDKGSKVASVLDRDRAIVIRYIIAAEAGFQKPNGKYVIAMPLVSSDAAHTWGLIRNAQLAPVIFPGWTLQVYTSHSLIRSTQVTFGNGTICNNASISMSVVNTLERLGAKIVYVERSVERSIHPSLWHYLVADERQVDVFIVRNAMGRLSMRDHAVVQHGLRGKKPIPVQCIRDHPNHASQTMIDGLWGAQKKLSNDTKGYNSMRDLLQKYTTSVQQPTATNVPDAFLQTVLYPKLQSTIVYYDGINCDNPKSRPFPVDRTGLYYIGQQHDAHEQPVLDERKTILSSRNFDCEPNL